MNKKEDEIARRKDAEAAKHQWEEEKYKIEESKLIEEGRRRHVLIERRRVWNEKRERDERRRERESEQDRRLREEAIEHNRQQWEQLSFKQQQARELKILEKQREALLKKKVIEENLNKQEKEYEEFQKSVAEYRSDMLERAAAKKLKNEVQNNVELRRKNEDRVKRHRQKSQEITFLSEKENEEMRQSINDKHLRAQSNFEKVISQREKEIVNSHNEREKKLMKTRMNLVAADAELQSYQRELDTYNRVKVSKAEQFVNERLEKERQRVHEEREMRERLQRQNKKRVEEDFEYRKNETQDTISKKDEKSHQIEMEKSFAMQQLRATALASQNLREELIRKYERESFDQKAFKCEMENRIGKGVLTHAKNESSYKIY